MFEKQRNDGSLPLLPKLSDASVVMSTDADVSKTYRSGARFIGLVRGATQVGSGTFLWPDGARYVGEFLGYHRHGHGLQVWSDGSSYEGNFVNDERQGQGKLLWSSGEEYVGQFYCDQKHGNGTYSWPNGSSYRGYVHRNLREGYGTFNDANNNVFQGLYKSDQRFGPGVLTYVTTGQQDVGLWLRDKLARLVVRLHSFSIQDHPEYGYVVNDTYVTVPSRTSLLLEVPDFRQQVVGNSNNCNSIARSGMEPTDDDRKCIGCEDNNAVKSVIEDSNKSSVEAIDNSKSSEETVVAWNTSPLFIGMQCHILQSRMLQRNISFDVDNLMSGQRGGYKEPGPIEHASMLLHRAVERHQLSVVENLLDSSQSYVDVSDNTGMTPLIAAAMKRNLAMINCLLDHGADINRLTDERMSALTICFVFYYPVEIFRLNIAEHVFEGIQNQKAQFIYHFKDPSMMSLVSKSPKNKKKKSREFLDVNDLLQKKPSLRAKIQQYRQEQHEKIPIVCKGEVEETVISGLACADIVNQNAVEQNNEISPLSINDIVLNGPKEKSSLPPLLAVADSSDNEAIFEPAEPPFLVVDASNIEPDSSDILEAAVPQGSVHLMDGNTFGVHVLVDETHASMHADLGLLRKPSAQGSPYDGFESEKTAVSLPITVQDEQLDRCAVNLSALNTLSAIATETNCSGTVEKLTLDKIRESQFDATIKLLLKRGADPSVSDVPMQAIFFAVKAADISMVELLLQKGASVNSCLPDKVRECILRIWRIKQGGLSILHIAVALPCEESLQLTKVLLASGADVNAGAFEVACRKEDTLSGEKVQHRKRKALHIACARDDNYELASAIVRLLLNARAQIDAVCDGMSPLAVAIAHGNDLAVEELLSAGADPNQQLAPDVLSALCTVVNTKYEHRRTQSARRALIDRLIRSGADVMKQLPIGSKMALGTVVDYAHYIHGKDKRVAHMPYHALTPMERELYNDRQSLQNHLASLVRDRLTQSVERISQGRGGGSEDSVHETVVAAAHSTPTPIPYFKVKDKMCTVEQQVTVPLRRNKDKKREGSRNREPGSRGNESVAFNTADENRVYSEDRIWDSAMKSANASNLVTPDVGGRKKLLNKIGKKKRKDGKYDGGIQDTGIDVMATPANSCQSMAGEQAENEWSVSSGSSLTSSLSSSLSTSTLKVKCCYECGRSAFVHLQVCGRCKAVYFCSKTCRMKAWSARHKDECQKLCALLHPKKAAAVKGQSAIKDADSGDVKVIALSSEAALNSNKQLPVVTHPSKSALKLPSLSNVAADTKLKKRVSLFGISDKWSLPKLTEPSSFDIERRHKPSSPRQPPASPLSKPRGGGDNDDWAEWQDARQDVISLARFGGTAKARRTSSLPNVGGPTAEQLYHSKAYSWIPEHLRSKDVVISNYSLV